MPDPAKDALLAFIKFARQHKKGHLAIAPKTGRPPLTVTFDKKKVIARDVQHAEFRFADDRFLVLGRGLTPVHVKGLIKTFRDNGLSKYDVVLDQPRDDNDDTESVATEYGELLDDETLAARAGDDNDNPYDTVSYESEDQRKALEARTAAEEAEALKRDRALAARQKQLKANMLLRWEPFYNKIQRIGGQTPKMSQDIFTVESLLRSDKPINIDYVKGLIAGLVKWANHYDSEDPQSKSVAGSSQDAGNGQPSRKEAQLAALGKRWDEHVKPYLSQIIDSQPAEARAGLRSLQAAFAKASDPAGGNVLQGTKILQKFLEIRTRQSI
ncbi:hypothetical protein [Frigidibacter sp. ROC022]|uniref:hypothetical protein n=1 Tax=Frigidibacter sp. ROC022 TaxID=2971796 RepID=UPI00215AA511|nr:hypothetical protein [Frigidibacter sp. ROC022]MCR8722741.1 hypothetical protein [Frigidibacter sp. ROC022]